MTPEEITKTIGEGFADINAVIELANFMTENPNLCIFIVMAAYHIGATTAYEIIFKNEKSEKK